MLQRACAYAQTHKNICCLHKTYEDLEYNFRPLAPLYTQSLSFKGGINVHMPLVQKSHVMAFIVETNIKYNFGGICNCYQVVLYPVKKSNGLTIY